MPSNTNNLISVGRFAKGNSVFFEFHLDYFVVKSQDTKDFLLQGSVVSDGLNDFPNLNFLSQGHQSKSSSTAVCLVS